jgi:hypothetical protein
MELSNESLVYLVLRFLALRYKYLAEHLASEKSSCLMQQEMQLGLHLSHELLLRVSLVDQADIFQSLDLDEMVSMHLASSKVDYSSVSEHQHLVTISMSSEHFVLLELPLSLLLLV